MAAMINPLDLSGKTILVTGASSGIGRDTCTLLSQLGATIVLSARRVDQLEKTLGMLADGDHLVCPFNVCEVRDTAAWMREVVKKSGPLDGVAHVAGITNTEAIRFLDFAKMEQLIDLNLKAPLAIANAFRQKTVRRAGVPVSMVLVSSVAAIRGYPGLSVYSATKGGVNSLMRTLAAELAKEMIRVNSVVPGLVRTEMVEELGAKHVSADAVQASWDAHPLGEGRARDVSNLIAFLLADASRWITGTSMVVDGGLTAN
jgi:NAD(P)-dependent dehydrogenase (short-subunit alcohol dehydrogenase family)